MTTSQNGGIVQKSSSWRWIGALFLLLALLVLWATGYGPAGRNSASCCGASNSSSAQAAPLEAQWNSADHKIYLTGKVPDVARAQLLLDAAVNAYGANNVIDHLHLTPGATIPSTITLTGNVASAADKISQGNIATSAFQSHMHVDNQLQVQLPSATLPTPANAMVTANASAISESTACSKAMRVRVEFSVRESKLTRAGEKTLSSVVSCVTQPMEIGGHTDNQGTDERNLKLSQARAEAVKAFLVSQGVRAELLTAVGYGASKPLEGNTTPKERRRNRRIELIAK